MLKIRFKNSGSLHAKTIDPECLQDRLTMQTNEEGKSPGPILAQTGFPMQEGGQWRKREKKLVEILRESEQRFRAALACEQQARTEAEARASQLEATFEANRRMDEFLSIVSHELRTPLTAIKGNIQLAQLQLKKVAEKVGLVEGVNCRLESVRGLLERADRQIGMQNRLVSDLLDVSRIQANKLELRLEPCNLVDIVREAIRDQEQTSPLRTISLALECLETVLVMADVDRIGQVVTNYLTNALKYSEVDRPVEVYMQIEGHVARVSVRDEGPGLPETEQQHIWERFYRVEGIEVQSGTGIGLGLGLHICKTIIECHHGQVGVQSAPGQGSTFWFTLPTAD